MALNRPQHITDASKYQTKTVNGLTFLFAQHEDEKNKYSIMLPGVDDMAVVATIKEGANLDLAQAEAAKVIVAQRQAMEMEKQMMDELMNDPQKLREFLAFAKQFNDMLAQEMGPASPGFSRLGQFGGGFGGNMPEMNSDVDNTDAMRPRTPHGI